MAYESPQPHLSVEREENANSSKKLVQLGLGRFAIDIDSEPPAELSHRDRWTELGQDYRVPKLELLQNRLLGWHGLRVVLPKNVTAMICS